MLKLDMSLASAYRSAVYEQMPTDYRNAIQSDTNNSIQSAIYHYIMNCYLHGVEQHECVVNLQLRLPLVSDLTKG